MRDPTTGPQPPITAQGLTRIAEQLLRKLPGRASREPAPARRLAPSPPALPLIGHLADFKSRRLQAFGEVTRLYGDIVRMDFVGMTGHLLSHPDHARYVLVERQRIYTKKTRGIAMLRQILGEGLLTSEGEHWRRQRRIAQPAFHRRQIASLSEAMVRESLALAERWDRYADRGEPLDLAHEMMRLTLRVVVVTLLGSSIELDAEKLGAAVSGAIVEANRRIGSLYIPPDWLPTRRNRAFQRDLRILDEIVFAILRERRARGGGEERSGDLLDMLLGARDEETGEGMTDRQLRDELMTIFLAGHETTANALSWTFYLLARHPEVHARLLEELEGALSGRPPTLEDLPSLPYLEQVLREALRLYPPAWMLARSPSEDDEIDGYFIPRGSVVLVSPFYVHRHPDFWERPEAFAPERFEKERAAARHRYAYLPFGAGQRICIGEAFAMMEARLILATLLPRFGFRLLPGRRIQPDALVTLRPNPGVWATLHLR